MAHVKVLFGTASFGSLPTETSQEFLDILKKYKVKDLDTAHLYVSKGSVVKYEKGSSLSAPQEGSERTLKELGATSSFKIHTKAPGFVKDSGTKASILAGAKRSFEDLGVKSVRLFLETWVHFGETADIVYKGRNLFCAFTRPRHSD